MTIETPLNSDVRELMDEIQRYLAAVDAFRAEGRAPCWEPESREPAAPQRRSRPLVRG
jgi:hypothetical protein